MVGSKGLGRGAGLVVACALVAGIRPSSPQEPSLVGEYAFTGSSTDSTATYSGTASIRRTGDTYVVVQRLDGGGGEIRGIGVAHEGRLAVMFEVGPGHSYVALYTPGADGDLEGVWTMPGLETTGRERLVAR